MQRLIQIMPNKTLVWLARHVCGKNVLFQLTGKTSSVLNSEAKVPQWLGILMAQSQITEVESHKHLGVIFSNNCTWRENLELIKSKAWKWINVMRKLNIELDRKYFQTIYFSFIRPLLEYADVVWNNCAQNESNELEKLQIEAARIVTGTTKLVSKNALLLETGWETLASRRKKLTLFFKMQNGLSPDYLTSLVPATVGSTSSYPLRNASNLQKEKKGEKKKEKNNHKKKQKKKHANSQLYYNSFLPSVIRDWNELPGQTRHSPSLNSFKKSINISISTPPRYYNTG